MGDRRPPRPAAIRLERVARAANGSGDRVRAHGLSTGKYAQTLVCQDISRCEKKAPVGTGAWMKSGAVERTRTPNPLVRSQMLYPIELLPQHPGIQYTHRRQRPQGQTSGPKGLTRGPRAVHFRARNVGKLT